ncbi:copper resistance CopC family protein [Rudaeicoccus suwonensis]|uniref:CopC domain-containing protein n=1 Tax=Rudaeicoccus suwonensis TaxID=657409 RepID=A0A561E7C7_9MICO|nr:copper resistance CopC family protein [Rudaeicoccus suwonensis]TWE11523.1 hypothetical protein BKA23_0293 [Rudaeicoccus suwonensis]
MRRHLTVLGAALLLPILWLAGASSASAHDELVSTTPGAGTTVAHAPATVTLTFNESVVDTGTQVQVRSSTGAVAQTGRATVSGAVVTQPLKSNLASGDYTVVWRATSADGHPVSGTFGFTVAAAAGTSSAGASMSASAPASTSSSSLNMSFTSTSSPTPTMQTPTNKTNNEPVLIIVAVVVAILVIGGVTALIRTRAKDDDADL